MSRGRYLHGSVFSVCFIVLKQSFRKQSHAALDRPESDQNANFFVHEYSRCGSASEDGSPRGRQVEFAVADCCVHQVAAFIHACADDCAIGYV